MIFVTVGTSEPFDRLLRALEALPRGEQLIVQRGASSITVGGARCIDFMPYEQLIAHMRVARVVVMHAGVGSVLAARRSGKVPIVVPRLARHGEAVDDHQVEFARRLDAAGLVRLVEDPAELPTALAEQLPAANGSAGAGALVAELRAYLRA